MALPRTIRINILRLEVYSAVREIKVNFPKR